MTGSTFRPQVKRRVFFSFHFDDIMRVKVYVTPGKLTNQTARRTAVFMTAVYGSRGS